MATWKAIIVHHFLCVVNQKPFLRRFTSWITEPHVQQLQLRSTQTLSWVTQRSQVHWDHFFLKESWKQLPTWIPQKQQNRALLVMTRLRLRYFESVLSFCSQSLPHCCRARNRIKWVCRIWPRASSEIFLFSFFFLLSQMQAHPVRVSGWSHWAKSGW